VPFADVADRGDQRADKAAIAPLPAARIEYLFLFFRHEGHLAAAPPLTS
jgi:hypothetical protein